MGRAELTLIGEYLQAEGGRRERQSEAHNQGGTHRQPQRQGHQGDDRTCGKHLSGAETKHATSHNPQSGRFQLDADDKQQEDDTKLRQVSYLVHGR